jgi:hypothetical protein
VSFRLGSAAGVEARGYRSVSYAMGRVRYQNQGMSTSRILTTEIYADVVMAVARTGAVLAMQRDYLAHPGRANLCKCATDYL